MEIGVLGAGAIGLYLGVTLSGAGARIRMVDRRDLSGMRGAFEAVGLDGRVRRPGPDLRISMDVEDLRSVSLCLVAVKSESTEAAARSLAPVIGPGASVISFQNGLHNAARLREHIRGDVVPGVVGFNVVRDAATVRQLTRGALFVGPGQGATPRRLGELKRRLGVSGLALRIRTNMEDVMAGKLLMNLSNGVCGATGLSIPDLLRSRDARWCFARCIDEGLTVLRAAGFKPARAVALPPALVVRALSLPDAILSPMARVLASAKEGARSSTLQDLDAGRTTEITALCGEIVGLARPQGRRTPANKVVLEVVQGHERVVRGGDPIRFVSPRELRDRIEARARGPAMAGNL